MQGLFQLAFEYWWVVVGFIAYVIFTNSFYSSGGSEIYEKDKADYNAKFNNKPAPSTAPKPQENVVKEETTTTTTTTTTTSLGQWGNEGVESVGSDSRVKYDESSSDNSNN